MGTFDRLVWALGHSLWESAIVAAVLWGTLRVLPVRYARLRYAVSLAAIGAVVFALFVTWRGVHVGAGGGSSVISVVPAGQRGAVTAGLPGRVVAERGGGQGLSPHARVRWTVVLGLLWGMGVLVMLIRMGVGLGRAQRLAGEGRPVELPELQRLARGWGSGGCGCW